MFPDSFTTDAVTLLNVCRRRKLTVSTAESCTGGLIAGLLTDIPGSSDVFDRGFVTYSNTAKIEMLWVDSILIEKHGAVSSETATAMADGAKARSRCDLALAVTGIAGPGGATKTKPVGLVYIALAYGAMETCVEEHHFTGTRQDVRLATVKAALSLALRKVKQVSA